MITFFFGSGADTDANESLKSGRDFAEKLLLDGYANERTQLLGKDYSRYKLIYPASSKVFLQTINTYREEAQKVLDPKEYMDCINYYQDKNSISYDIIRKYCSKWYSIINKEQENAVKDFFLTKAVFFDALDEKFNSLRFTDFNDSAKRVINAYATVFIFMLKTLYNIEPEFLWDYSRIFEKLQDKYDISINPGCYYDILNKSDINCSVITTNYTSIVDDIIGSNVIHLHGNLKWFEDLSDLSVYDCEIDDDRKHLNNAKYLIPFILIPSGVKPIICTKQIEKFNEFIVSLKNSCILFVVGYRFNSEDNHINSIIAEWLREANHKLLYLNYENDICFKDFSWSKYYDQIDINCSTKDFEFDISDRYRIYNFLNCKERSREVFKLVINYLS